MAKLFPGILYATLAAVPGWIIGTLVASPRLRRLPLAQSAATFARETPVFFMLYAVVTLSYGSLAWIALRMFGALNLPALLVVALLPVVPYAIFAAARSGDDAPWYGAAVAVGVPALFVACALWAFTVWMPQ